jgi:radical SAM superfamily enzyme YgiQ (UPF0313 family)
MYDAIFFTECNGSPGWGRDAGCYTVSSRLREHGYTTKVIDFFSHFNFERFKKSIDNFADSNTLILGFSSTHFSSLKPEDWYTYWRTDNRTRKSDMWNVYFPFEPTEMEEWITYAKSKYPKLKVIVGGQKVAQKQALQKKYPFVDHWIGGMADVSIVEILSELKQGKTLSNRIKSEHEYGSISEHDFNYSKIHWNDDDNIFPGEALPLEVSRGCPFNCAFCDYRKKEVNTWTLDSTHLRDMLIENYERFDVKHYMLTDFQVNENSNKMDMLFKVFTSLPFKITWAGFGRLDILATKTDMINQIYESGCRSMQWGIETITDAVGPIIGKVTRRDSIETALENCKSVWGNDIIMGSGFVLGLPGEDLNSCKNVLKWISEQPWLDAWEITPLYIGQYNANKAYTIDYSRIQIDPKKFGYDISLTLNSKGYYTEDWYNNDMSKSVVIKLIEEEQTGEAWQRRLMTSYLNYSRSSNLGFDHDDLLVANKYNTEWINEHARRYIELGTKYLKINKL